MALSKSEPSAETNKVISPFADSEVAVSRKKAGTGKLFLIIGTCLILIVAGAVTGILIMRYLDDPYRTLENFSVSKYLNGYQALAGSKFKAEFRVEADLGWKDGAGRLM